MEFKVCVSTDKGTVKEVNQDSTMVKVAYAGSVGRIAMGVLCDGMGGLSHGEVASSMLIERFEQWFAMELPAVLGRITEVENLDEDRGKYDIISNIRQEWMSITEETNLRILSHGMQQGAALGTTIVSFLMVGREFIVMNVGDSRVYMLTDNTIDLLTHDQSVVQNMIDRGIITEQEAEANPQKSVLLQCVGVADHVEPQFIRGVIGEQTTMLLCSDGFWRKASKEELLTELSPSNCDSEESMREHLDGLLDKVKDRGETDNISAILIDCVV